MYVIYDLTDDVIVSQQHIYKSKAKANKALIALQKHTNNDLSIEYMNVEELPLWLQCEVK